MWDVINQKLDKIIELLEKNMEEPQNDLVIKSYDGKLLCQEKNIPHKIKNLPFYEDYMEIVRQDDGNTKVKTIEEFYTAIINFNNNLEGFDEEIEAC